ncbi:unnamed protein product [Blepharisma stoltei]|uniref:Uncharacterized protein n=1 Tax=Blepharisma stoltei TaxID=1481888 RepID=A0AAU9JQ97_9CILI|nr:unnamed protein product [Blepharisma stoltei]
MNKPIFLGDAASVSASYLKSPKASPKTQTSHRHSLSPEMRSLRLISLKNLRQERSILKFSSNSRESSPDDIQSKVESITEQWHQIKSGLSARPQAENHKLSRYLIRARSAERLQNDHSQELLKIAIKASSVLQKDSFCKNLENSSIKETQDTDCSMHQEEKFLSFLPVPCATEVKTTINRAKPSLVMGYKGKKPPRLIKKNQENVGKPFETCYKLFLDSYKKVNV